jgi:hypothetical protein
MCSVTEIPYLRSAPDAQGVRGQPQVVLTYWDAFLVPHCWLL